MNDFLFELEYTLSFSMMKVSVFGIGSDYQILIAGGDTPHVGSVAVAIPRPSLTGDGSISVTSSVYNLTGHKDEHICRKVAECAAKASGRTAVCSGGFHLDGATKEHLEEVLLLVKQVEKDIAEKITNV